MMDERELLMRLPPGHKSSTIEYGTSLNAICMPRLHTTDADLLALPQIAISG